MEKQFLDEIQNWYKKQCNGDWEHEYGIKIETLDNPGWSIQIDLKGTSLEGISFDTVELNDTEEDWLHCKVHENVYLGFCGPLNLEKVIGLFLWWANKIAEDRYQAGSGCHQ